ncbi:MAG TPA: carboxypeptidase-like regulatory domain-containing protein [Vicinamibacterales bacterium]|nr:carboxypeptidase-like regulatory domain-containing protein [Vicinamibacterales bacterium]
MTLASLLLLGFVVQASPAARWSGIVRDATGLPLAGAAIEVDGALVSVTGADGRFTIPAGPPPQARVRITLPGFETRHLTLAMLAGPEPYPVVLELARVADALRRLIL